jgi:hypothetical protein
MTTFTARRTGSDFDLYANGFRFGRLADCETAHVFICDDERLDQHVQFRIEPDFSIREKFSAIRAGYENYLADLENDVLLGRN